MEWKKVRVELPNPYKTVQVKTKTGAIGTAYYSGNRWITTSNSGVRLNHYADGPVTEWASLSPD